MADSKLSGHMIIQPKINERHQILSSLRMVGSGFEAQGGASLMLTEAVENGVDAIIDALRKGLPDSGQIRVFIDQVAERVIIVDNGTGFLQVIKAIEKPYESVKADDPEQTGKWGRGLQGFRSFCSSLEFYTRRQSVPLAETITEGDPDADGRTLRITFNSEDIDIKLSRIADTHFDKWFEQFDNSAPYQHGTIAVYEHWRKGQFAKLRKEDVIRRIEHHFGEEIRKGTLEIIVEVYEGKLGILPKGRSYVCAPKDYSAFTPLGLKPAPYVVGGKHLGEIKFNLFLSERGRKDRWEFPYLLFEGRPVGDGFITEIDEFRENPIWASQYLTGYITCDFCHINETRTALKKGDELDFLFKALKTVEPVLEGHVRKHARGLYDLRLQKQINEMVMNLQRFLKNEHLFEFKMARNTGTLTEEDKEVEVVQIVATTGTDAAKEVSDPAGVGTALDGSVTVLPTPVSADSSTDQSAGGAFTAQHEIGGHGNNPASSKEGGPNMPTTATPDGEKGYTENPQGVRKPSPQETPLTPGGEGSSNKAARRARPRGFGVAIQEDEINPEPSWFDAVNSYIVINSGHERYVARDNEGSRSKELLDYIAELYLWEIAKLIKKEATAHELGTFFIDLKFKYFEKTALEKPKESEANA